MTADRIALISDCEGNVAALQAALRAIKRHAPDSIVVAGDILASPFSPDPPSETIALLRPEPVQAIPGNTDRYLLDWGTPRWPHTLWMRLRRSDPAGSWLDDMVMRTATEPGCYRNRYSGDFLAQLEFETAGTGPGCGRGIR